MTADELLTHWTTRWGFRPRGPFEGPTQYREAAVAYLRTRDWAAAHEVHIGKPQAEWTPEEVKTFEAWLVRPAHYAREHAPVPATFLEFDDMPTTWASLVTIATRSFNALAAQRRAKPLGELPIFVHVVTVDGKVLVTTCSSNDRIGVLRAAAEQLPLFGYVLVFDAFVHGLDHTTGKASKRDALTAHLGTREDRHVLQRKYTVTGPTVTFDPDEDLDMRALVSPDGKNQSFVDPYAEIFVTVPRTTSVQ